MTPMEQWRHDVTHLMAAARKRRQADNTRAEALRCLIADLGTVGDVRRIMELHALALREIERQAHARDARESG